MQRNKSCKYLFPLTEEWSAKADPPINCFAISDHSDSLICVYDECVVAKKYMTEYMPDVELIMIGKYSRVSNECKSLLLDRTPELEYEHLEGVLYKRDRRRLELNKMLEMDITQYCDEYESKFGKEEICRVELSLKEMCSQESP